MLLAVDVGNTQTVIGIYNGENLLNMWRLATRHETTSDEIRIKLIPLFKNAGVHAANIDKAALASVVPQLTEAWRHAVLDFIGCEMLLCNAETAGALFRADYPNPQEIGADRIADAVAMREIYGAPSVVVDFGTATNIEVLDKSGMFVGGIIAPGLQTSAETLFSNASKLPAVTLCAPDNPIGKNTVSAMQSGIVLGEVDRVEGLLRRVFKQLGYNATVVATGGLAPLIAQYTDMIDNVNPELTLEGLRLISDANEK